MIHPLLTGPRVESYEVELLDRNDQRLGTLDAILSGTVEQNIDARIKGGCSFETDSAVDIDWHQSRVRPWVTVNGLRWPLGVFLPTSPEVNYSATKKSWGFEGVDKLSILDADAVPESFSVAEGTPVVDKIVEIINSAGEEAVTVTPDPGTTREQLVWDPGTAKLTIINDLLQVINYDTLWADGFGRYRIEPYIHPSRRTPRLVFEKGDYAVHGPNITRTQDIASVPNRVIMTTSGSDDTPALRSVAENRDPDSPYSYENRGNRWVTKTYEGAEAADQESLDRQASRNLWNSSTPPAYYEVSHAVLPVEAGEVVRLLHDDIDALVQVNEYSIDMSPGSLMGGAWKEVSVNV